MARWVSSERRAEVMPESEGDRGQSQSTAAAALVGHLVVAIRRAVEQAHIFHLWSLRIPVVSHAIHVTPLGYLVAASRVAARREYLLGATGGNVTSQGTVHSIL